LIQFEGAGAPAALPDVDSQIQLSRGKGAEAGAAAGIL
jgi:hypothetical protein